MFVERLNRIANRIEGALALVIAAEDGIGIESVSKAPGLDLELLVAELVAQVRAISEAEEEVEIGSLRQLSVRTDQMSLLASRVGDHHYLILVLDATGNLGQARFELKRSALLLEEDLD